MIEQILCVYLLAQIPSAIRAVQLWFVAFGTSFSADYRQSWPTIKVINGHSIAEMSGVQVIPLPP